MLAPALAAAAALVFLFCLTSFGIVLVLGTPYRSTLETEIYSEAVRSFDLQAAAVLSLVQLAIVVGVVAISSRLEARLAAAGELVPEREAIRRATTWRDKAVVAASLGSLGLALLVPPAVLVERSLAVGDGHSLDAFRELTKPTSTLLAAPWEAVVNSLVYATAATGLALLIGGLAAIAVASLRGRTLLDALLMLPLGASAVMLGFGFVITFDSAPLDFRASPWIIPVAQALVAIPFVVRLVAPALRGIDQRQRDAAAALGASPSRVRREVDLPVVRRALAVAAGFAFAISLGEFGATVFLARPDRPPLPVAVYRFLGRPGELNTAQAYALGVVLMVVTACSVLLVERARGWRGTI
jgi:thiamine transport system permease protein